MRLLHTEAIRKSYVYWFLAGYAFLFVAKLGFFPLPLVAQAISSIVFWSICVVVSFGSSKRKIFRSKTVILFFAGMYVWILWGLFASVSRIALATGMGVYKGVITLALFTHSLFMAARIVEMYGLRFRIVRLTLYITASMLISRFVLYFGGFSLSLSSLANILQTDGRVRYGFGYGQVNELGVVCMLFFIMFKLYSVMADTDSSLPNQKYLFALLCLPVSVMLLSSASRSSILSLAIFLLTIRSLSAYGKSKKITRSFMIISIVIVLAIMPWGDIFNAFWYSRWMNYERVIPFVTQKKAWFAGIGMMTRAEIQDITGTQVMDSTYLYITLQSGIVGAVIFFGNLLTLILAYFHRAENMTQLQICTAGIIMALLFYALFEGGTFYGHSGMDMIFWIIIVICANERLSRHSSSNPPKTP